MIRVLLLGAGLLIVAPAAAQTPALDAARAAGQIGERFDGYIGIVSQVAPAVRSQVAAINIRRRTLYSNLAASRSAAPQDVGITAGCQLIARVGTGGAYMLIDGTWRRRTAGQAAPSPDYCR
jgi:uncharacterized protein YdbL (DUF1318 family)